jgi:hypothetical protein
MLFQCVDELIARRQAGEPGPDRLEALAMGKWEEKKKKKKKRDE